MARRALSRLTAALLFALGPLTATPVAAIPATRVMTVYQFDGPLDVPYYDVAGFRADGPGSPSGTLAQGTAVIPCLVIRGGKPLTDARGTPYVGFEVVVDSRQATAESTARFTEVSKQRQSLTVANHHCPPGITRVIDVRELYGLETAPRFDPPVASGGAAPAQAVSEIDAVVRAFHASPQCTTANRLLLGRHDALQRAWDSFSAEHSGRWPATTLRQARQLDYAMRTALYEGHLARGCSAYGACERNAIALTIRNRAVERCLRGQGCRSEGDFEGVASTISQYNIWDEYLTQTTGLTACFLRPDLADQKPYAKVQAMYAQSVGAVERILYAGDAQLQAIFPDTSLADLKSLRHYYHPPAMGKCFPGQPRIEYISGAVARNGDQFALIADSRIQANEKVGTGYLFEVARVEVEPTGDVVSVTDRYPGFVIDGRKVELKAATRCKPYGVPGRCAFQRIGRYRKTPSWLSTGFPLQVRCLVEARGEDCRLPATPVAVDLGGSCDIEMQPVAGVP